MINEKALFIGPFGENKDAFKANVLSILEDVVQWRRNFHPFDPKLISNGDKRAEEFESTQDLISEKLDNLLSEMKQSVPFHSPRFLGHMHSDLAIPALLGYITGLLYNQNNVVGESSPITTRKEIEFVTKMCKMVGYEPFSLHSTASHIGSWGHICSGGTTANIEAVWVARNMKYYPISIKLIIDNVKIEGITIPPELIEKLKAICINGKALEHYSYLEVFNFTTINIVSLYSSIIDSLSINLNEYDANSALSAFNKIFIAYDIRSLGVSGIHDIIPNEKLELPKLIVSNAGHYSWDKCLDIVGIGNSNVRRLNVDLDFRLDTNELTTYLTDNPLSPILIIVGIVGTTEEGAIDPILKINSVMNKDGRGFYFHIDGAYGGYFSACIRSTNNDEFNRNYYSRFGKYLENISKDIEAIAIADSIAIDPHKLGYVPYAAGSIFYKNTFYKNFIFKSAPYLAQASQESAIEKTYMGGWTLEGSRPGAAALACALSTEIIPLDYSGYGYILSKSIEQTKKFHDFLINYKSSIISIAPIYNPQTNIVCYAVSVPDYITKPDYVNLLTNEIANEMTIVPEKTLQNYQFVVSKTDLNYQKYSPHIDKVLGKLNVSTQSINSDFNLEFLRTVIMHPSIDGYEVNVWQENRNQKINLFEALIKELEAIARKVLPKVLLDIISKERNGNRIKIIWIENKESFQKHSDNILIDEIFSLPEIGKFLDITFYNYTDTINNKNGLEAIEDLTKNQNYDFSIIDLNLADNHHIEWESGIGVINKLFPTRESNSTYGVPILFSKFFDDVNTANALKSFFKPYPELFFDLNLQFLGKQAFGNNLENIQETNTLSSLIMNIFKILQINKKYGT